MLMHQPHSSGHPMIKWSIKFSNRVHCFTLTNQFSQLLKIAPQRYFGWWWVSSLLSIDHTPYSARAGSLLALNLGDRANQPTSYLVPSFSHFHKSTRLARDHGRKRGAVNAKAPRFFRWKANSEYNESAFRQTKRNNPFAFGADSVKYMQICNRTELHRHPWLRVCDMQLFHVERKWNF